MGVKKIKGTEHSKLEKSTLAPSDDLEASKARFSNARSTRKPSAFASILIPFSLAETASSVPFLLKRIRGLALHL